MATDNFYRAFEEKYYAPRTVIKELRRQYLPLVEQLIKHYPSGQTYDLGCGRGEWLELMQELQLTPYGVDLDDGMLQGCRDLGLPAEKGDAVSYLKTLDSESHLVISAFHVVEHISFSDLQEIVQEALRVLKPGGLLIMETPNPENIKVATANFYLDPTHIRPIPSQLLSFLTEHYGFGRTKILRLNESQEVHHIESITLLQVISGVSPDYAVVAQKQASNEIMSNFDELFSKEYGLSLDSLLNKFERRIVSVEVKATMAEQSANEANARAVQAEQSANEANARAVQAEQLYHMIERSNSWKITKPLRLAGKFARWFVFGSYHWLTFSPTSRPRRVLKRKLIELKHYINVRPKLKYKIINILNKFPTLKARLKRIGNSEQSYHVTQNTKLEIKNSEFSHLSPQAKRIYFDLKYAIEQRKYEAQK